MRLVVSRIFNSSCVTLCKLKSYLSQTYSGRSRKLSWIMTLDIAVVAGDVGMVYSIISHDRFGSLLIATLRKIKLLRPFLKHDAWRGILRWKKPICLDVRINNSYAAITVVGYSSCSWKTPFSDLQLTLHNGTRRTSLKTNRQKTVFFFLYITILSSINGFSEYLVTAKNVPSSS